MQHNILPSFENLDTGGGNVLFFCEVQLKSPGYSTLFTDRVLDNFPPQQANPRMRVGTYSMTGRLGRLFFLWESDERQKLQDISKFLTDDEAIRSYTESLLQRFLKPTSYHPPFTMGQRRLGLNDQLRPKNGQLEAVLLKVQDLLPKFVADTEFELSAAGVLMDPSNDVMHFWRLENADQLSRAMSKLKDSVPYGELQALIQQEEQDLTGGLGRDVPKASL